MLTLVYEGMNSQRYAFRGFSHDQVADHLTEENWTSRYVVRVGPAGWLCVGVARHMCKDVSTYYVDVFGEGGTERNRKYHKEYPTIGEALAYANGEGDTELARETRRATPGEYPPEKHGMVLVMSLPRVPRLGTHTPQEGCLS